MLIKPSRSAGRRPVLTHSIEHQQVADYLELDNDHKVVCAIAIGIADTPDILPADKPVP